MKWISVDDRLPEEDYRYLVTGTTQDITKPFILIAWFTPHIGEWELIMQPFAEAVTHWMPLPEAP